MRALGFATVAAALLASPSVLAQPWDPIGRSDVNGNPGVVRIPQGLPAPTVSDPWGERVTQRRYRSGTGLAPLNVFTEVMWPLYDKLFNDFDDDLAKQIADGCRSAYAGNSWGQIRCASEAIDLLLDDHDLTKAMRSPCRSHARALAEVIDALEIPGVRTAPLVMPRHVLNRLFVTTPDGQVFQYALDVGWDQDKIYPNNDAARRWHDRNRDGITDVFVLPTLPTQGDRIDYSFRAAASPPGVNVPRNAATTGAVAGTSTPSAGGASGAGMRR